jgi:hypothetical protein
MKRNGPVFLALAIGFVLGTIIPTLLWAAPRVGDAKFENQFIKTFAPSSEKPLVFRVPGGELTVTSIVGVEDDFVVVQLRSKDPALAYVRIRDVIAVSQPTN